MTIEHVFALIVNVLEFIDKYAWIYQMLTLAQPREALGLQSSLRDSQILIIFEFKHLTLMNISHLIHSKLRMNYLIFLSAFFSESIIVSKYVKYKFIASVPLSDHRGSSFLPMG